MVSNQFGDKTNYSLAVKGVKFIGQTALHLYDPHTSHVKPRPRVFCINTFMIGLIVGRVQWVEHEAVTSGIGKEADTCMYIEQGILEMVVLTYSFQMKISHSAPKKVADLLT